MNRYQSQIIYGLLICATGAVVALLSYDPSRTIQYAVAAGMLLASIFSFLTSSKTGGNEIPLKYNRMLGAGMLVYALVVLFYASTFERFTVTTMVFLLYFGITELLFGFGLMAYKTKISLIAISARMILGFLMSIGAVLILALAINNKNVSLLFAGLLIFLSGISFIWFANFTRRLGPIN
jgi:hypothetical protein